MKDPGDESYQDDEDYEDYDDLDYQDVQDDKTLLDELFGDAGDADAGDADDAGDGDIADEVTDDIADERLAPVAPGGSAVPVAREPAADSVALAEPGLAEPGLEERRLPAWQGVRWARSRVPPSGAPGFREIGLTTTGFVIFMIVDSIMMYAPFRTHGSTNLLPQAITLALLAFGLGALMIWSIRGACRPVGIGLMLGWVFMTLISAGYFTGLNP
jgi:hypothetical protein